MKKTVLKVVCLFLAGILLNGCGGQEATATPAQQPSLSPNLTPTPIVPTPTSTPEPPSTTNITIDGKPDDWVGRSVTLEDPVGDAEGSFLDLTTGYVFVNQNALYFLIESVVPTGPFVQFDIQFQAGSSRLQISWSPGAQYGFLGDFTSGWNPVGEITRSQFAFGLALEGRVDLRDMGSPASLSLMTVNVMAGECCDYPQWRAVEQWEPASTPTVIVNEVDPPRLISEEIKYVLARRFKLPNEYVAEPVLEPLLPGLFDIAQSESGIIYLAQWGEYAALSTLDLESGTVTEILDFPTGSVGWMADGPDDTIILGVKNEVWLISPDGSHEVWGKLQDAWPRYYLPDGRLLGESGGTRVVELYPDGTTSEVASGFDYIFDFVVNDQGVIFLTDFIRGDLVRIDPNGTQTVLADHLTDRDYIALYLDEADNLYIFSAAIGLVQVNPQTGALRKMDLRASCNLVGSVFVIEDSGEFLFVNTEAQVVELELGSGETKAMVPNNGTVTHGMAVGPDDALYLGAYDCSSRASRLLRVQDDGTQTTLADGLAGRVIDLTFDQQGGLYMVSDYDVFYLPPGGDALTKVADAPPGVSSVIPHPSNGRLLAAVWDGTLLEYGPGSGWTELPLTLPKAVAEFIIDAAPDGTVYAYASERERQLTGPIVERWLLRVHVESGQSEIIAQLDRQGSGPMGNLSVDPQGNIWWILNPENRLYRVSPDGQMTLFARRLPQDSPKAVVDSQGDVYVSSIMGVLRLHSEP